MPRLACFFILPEGLVTLEILKTVINFNCYPSSKILGKEYNFVKRSRYSELMFELSLAWQYFLKILKNGISDRTFLKTLYKLWRGSAHASG